MNKRVKRWKFLLPLIIGMVVMSAAFALISYDTFRDVEIEDYANYAKGLFKEHQRFEHDGSLERILIELRGYARRFVQDAEFRAQSLANAHDWLEGKPVRFVSELRLFGD